jgi:hypothetical protein
LIPPIYSPTMSSSQLASVQAKLQDQSREFQKLEAGKSGACQRVLVSDATTIPLDARHKLTPLRDGDRHRSQATPRLSIIRERARAQSKHFQPTSYALRLFTAQQGCRRHQLNSQEFTLLKPHNTVYKLVGPSLVPQDQAEAKVNVEKRLEFIRSEM